MEQGILTSRHVHNAAVAALVLLALFLAARVVTEVIGFGHIGALPMTNTISVSGQGEIYATADIASVQFTASEDKKTVEEAQGLVTESMDKALAFLKSQGVEEKDIKTTNYSIYPKYEWKQQLCVDRFPCPGENELVGYTVSQSIVVKVRDTSTIGSILQGIAEAGITNVSGPDFTIDDDAALRAEARAAAIQDAEEQAKKLAEALGVRLVRVVNFYENSGPMPYYAYGMGGDASAVKLEAARAPTIPAGENMVVSNVSITYEIR